MSEHNDINGWDVEEIPPLFELESTDQLQAISDPIRYRMILLLRETPMTGAQLARALNLSRPRAHYYLKTLVDSGLVVFRGEKIDNGMIGKYYRAIAHYYSYDNLATKSRDFSHDDPQSITILKAISDFALTVLETSRDTIVSSDQLAKGYHFNFETDLTEEQYETVICEIRALADHLLKIKKTNRQIKDNKPPMQFRTTIFFTPVPRNPMQHPIKTDKKSGKE